MRVLFFILSLLFIAGNLSAQCDVFSERVDMEFNHERVDTLKPGCAAWGPYDGLPVLTVSPRAGYQEDRYMVRPITEAVIKTRTYYDENCEQTTEIVSRRENTVYDTVLVSTNVIGERPGTIVGAYWTVRFELRTSPPPNRPVGSMATKLPKGSSHPNYWVIHIGEYNDKATAQVAVKQFVKEYPEFDGKYCAHAYLLPAGCEFQYEYR